LHDFKDKFADQHRVKVDVIRLNSDALLIFKRSFEAFRLHFVICFHFVPSCTLYSTVHGKGWRCLFVGAVTTSMLHRAACHYKKTGY